MEEQLSFIPAKNARDVGMLMVEEGVHNVYAEWSEHALVFLAAYLDCIGFQDFQAEDFRVWAVKEGLKLPVNKSGKTAWRILGPLFNRAKNRGMIEFVRIEPTKGVTAHRANAAVYTRATNERSPSIRQEKIKGAHKG